MSCDQSYYRHHRLQEALLAVYCLTLVNYAQGWASFPAHQITSPIRRCRPIPENFRNSPACLPLTEHITSSERMRHSILPMSSLDEIEDKKVIKKIDSVSPLSYPLEQLASELGGQGRALAVWEYYQNGIDPLDHLSDDEGKLKHEIEENMSVLGKEAHRRLARAFLRGDSTSQRNIKQSTDSVSLISGAQLTIRNLVADIVESKVASDGTVKLLIELQRDGLLVETVIFSLDKKPNDEDCDAQNVETEPNQSTPLSQSYTVCVSSQVGCRQACTFCRTGRMGIIRSLSADEILAQAFLAKAYLRDNMLSRRNNFGGLNAYSLDNLVFMGMGEPADNAQNVIRATQILTDRNQFAMAPRRITLSTVAPSVDAVAELAQAPVILAWSVHSSRNDVRKQLVPTTKHIMEELREAFIEALLLRSRQQRALMLELTLLDGINDSTDDAEHLANFCQPLLNQVPGIKLVVNLIPWNDIEADLGPARTYQKPSSERVASFQRSLIDRGIRCYIRSTRGDDQLAACGQLATASNKER